MSYNLDSRNEKVQLDYNDLLISTTTTFTKDVTFQGFLDGVVWPRFYKVGGTNYNYVAPGTATIPLTTQNVIIDQFVTAPTLDHSNWFTVGNNGVITVVNPATILDVTARIAIIGGLTTVGQYKFSLLYDIAGPTPTFSLSDYYIDVPATPPYVNTVSLHFTLPVVAGDILYVQLTGTANCTVILEWNIQVTK